MTVGIAHMTEYTLLAVATLRYRPRPRNMTKFGVCPRISREHTNVTIGASVEQIELQIPFE